MKHEPSLVAVAITRLRSASAVAGRHSVWTGAGALVVGYLLSACGPADVGPPDTQQEESAGDGGTGSADGEGAGGTGATSSGGVGGQPNDGAGGIGGIDGTGGGNEEDLQVGSACPGAVDPSEFEACRESSECSYGCVRDPVNYSGICGACFAPIVQCLTDDECADGFICQESPKPCECMGVSRSCVAGCTEDSCPVGQSCGADLRCAPTSCEAGFSCEHPLDTCDPTGEGADQHGCAPTTCEQDEACSEGRVCAPDRAAVDQYGCAPAHCALDGLSCAEGYHCDHSEDAGAGTGSSNGCVVDHCEDDADCAPNFVCEPDAVDTGCVRRTCATDGDCDCGYCIYGHCEERLWKCQMPPPA